jgi:hypothetical protein
MQNNLARLHATLVAARAVLGSHSSRPDTHTGDQDLEARVEALDEQLRMLARDVAKKAGL